MIVNVNGIARKLDDGAKISDVLAILGYESGRGLAVALDGHVVPKSRWDDQILRPGMRIEVLRAVQGG